MGIYEKAPSKAKEKERAEMEEKQREIMERLQILR